MYPIRYLFIPLLLLITLPAQAAESGDIVNLTGQRGDDTYAAGGTVNSTASINGDLLASGGTLLIEGAVSADAMLAGGEITVSATVGDDLRVAGGNVLISSTVGDDLMFAGGSLKLSSKSVVEGEAWIAGGQLDLAGEFRHGLHAAGGSVILTGHVVGDVDLTADMIQIGPGARIDGALRYRSPQAATIHPDARIQGEVVYLPSEAMQHRTRPGLFGLFTLMLTALLFYSLFRPYTNASVTVLNQEYWCALAMGVAMLLVVPFVAIFSMGIVIGVWLGLMLLALYAVMLVLGSILGMICSGEALARLLRFELNSTARHLLSIVVAYVLLGLLLYVPVLGRLSAFIILLSGLGAGSLVLYRRYSGTTVP